MMVVCSYIPSDGWLLGSFLNTWTEMTVTLVSSCCGFDANHMTNFRINSWYQKPSKARKSAPVLRTLPPTHKEFGENVKRVHFRVATWYSTVNQHLPNLGPTFYGWVRDEINKTLCPVGLPEGISPPPPKVLSLIKCNYSSNKTCSSKRCTCVSSKVACSAMSQCRGHTQRCFNEEKKLVDDIFGDDED